MRYVIAASRLIHRRSETVSSAAEGVEVANDYSHAGFAITISGQDHRTVTLEDLRQLAVDEGKQGSSTIVLGDCAEPA